MELIEKSTGLDDSRKPKPEAGAFSDLAVPSRLYIRDDLQSHDKAWYPQIAPKFRRKFDFAPVSLVFVTRALFDSFGC